MSEGFTVRGFLVAADNKTRRVRLKFNEVDWMDFLDEQFPLGGEVYISAKNVAADLAAAEERGRREGIKYVLENTVRVRKGHEYWNPNMDVYILDSDRFAAPLGAKEAGDGREGKKEARE